MESRSTPITVCSVSSGEFRRLGSATAESVTWSPDGTTLLSTAWNNAFNDGRSARILVPVDAPREVTVLTDFGNATDYVSHRWAYPQARGRDPG